MPNQQNGTRLDYTLAGILNRRRSRNQLRTLTTAPSGTIDFSSNAYLSLSTHSTIQQTFLARLQAAAASAASPPSQTTTTLHPNPNRNRNPTHNSPPSPPLLGSGGSRLLDGNTPDAESLEHTLAAFHRAPAALLFNSAMDANVGLLSSVPQPGDVVVYDELIHASVHDGMRLSRLAAAGRVAFRHGCVWEEAEVGGTVRVMGEGAGGGGGAGFGRRESLEGMLRSLVEGDDGELFRSGERNVFVAVEGVYSMDGDVAPLVDIVECVEHCLPQGNGYIIVDEAHSTGVFGDRGRGLVCELGLEGRVWARVLGFGKAMGCSGGMVLCSPTTRTYLINYARTLIYTTAMSFPTLAAIDTAYDFLMSGQADPLLAHLRLLVKDTHRLFLALLARHESPAELLRVNKETPRAPIIPVFTSQPRSLASHCQRRGFMVRPIVAPTVPRGSERVRVCLHAGNTISEVEGLVKAVEEWLGFVSREETGGRKSDSGKGTQGIEGDGVGKAKI